jgi:hypothetical protein
VRGIGGDERCEEEREDGERETHDWGRELGLAWVYSGESRWRVESDPPQPGSRRCRACKGGSGSEGER